MADPSSVRVVFMGTSRFSVPSLEALVRDGYQVVSVVSQPPRPAGRGRKVTAPPVVDAASRMGLPVLTPEKLRTPEAIEQVRDLRSDVIIVAAYAQFLPTSVLRMPAGGCLNVHASLLPRWRGASPIQASILAGDEFTGVTLMMMEPSMDTGAIVGQSVTGMQDDDTAPRLEDRLARAGAALLSSVLPCYLDGAATAVPQEESLATYAPLIRKEEGLIDWGQPVLRIWRANRAFVAWPGTFTHWNGRLIRVVSCRPLPESPASGPPGKVVPLDSGRGAAVIAGDGALELLEVAPEGGRPMSIKEFLAGHRDFPGSQLG